MNATKVLILNQTFEPFQVCTARRAVILLFAGKAERVEDTSRLIRSPSTALLLPSVIRLHRYVRKPGRPSIAFNKKNILRRDAHPCQYCGRNGGERMTIDHVVPAPTVEVEGEHRPADVLVGGGLGDPLLPLRRARRPRWSRKPMKRFSWMQ